MPLPPAPTKRAALLTKDALDTPVRPLAKPVSKQPAATKPVPNNWGIDRTTHEPQPEPAAARIEKRRPSPVKTLAVHSAVSAPAAAGKTRKPKPGGP